MGANFPKLYAKRWVYDRLARVFGALFWWLQQRLGKVEDKLANLEAGQ